MVISQDGWRVVEGSTFHPLRACICAPAQARALTVQMADPPPPSTGTATLALLPAPRPLLRRCRAPLAAKAANEARALPHLGLVRVGCQTRGNQERGGVVAALGFDCHWREGAGRAGEELVAHPSDSKPEWLRDALRQSWRRDRWLPAFSVSRRTADRPCLRPALIVWRSLRIDGWYTIAKTPPQNLERQLPHAHRRALVLDHPRHARSDGFVDHRSPHAASLLPQLTHGRVIVSREKKVNGREKRLVPGSLCNGRQIASRASGTVDPDLAASLELELTA